MLFDLKSGKRRRVVQVVFGFLAFIFFISFVGFGIGSDVSGGLFDAIGLGGDDGDDASPETQYQTQIEDAEAKVEKDPKDLKALSDLAYFRYQAGAALMDVDQESGTASVTEDTRSEWDKSLDAWDKVIAQKPEKLEPQTAAVMLCIYVPPNCGIQATEDTVDFAGAIKTQEVVVNEDPSSQNLALLAYFQLADGDIATGKKTSQEAIAKAKGSAGKDLEKQFGKLISQAEKIQKANEQTQDAATGDDGTGQLTSPFGGLGGDSGTGTLAP